MEPIAFELMEKSPGSIPAVWNDVSPLTNDPIDWYAMSAKREILVATNGRKFIVNWPHVVAIIFEWQYQQALLGRCRIERERSSRGLAWQTLYRFVVDSKNIREEVSPKFAQWFNQINFRLRSGMLNEVAENLADMRQETRSFVDQQLAKLKVAQEKTYRSMENHVALGNVGVELAKRTRNACAQFLLVGSAAVAIPAGLAALSGGAGLKGIGKYQDTGNIGSAVVEASGSFVVGLVGISSSTATVVAGESGGKAIFFVGSLLDSGFEGAKSLLEGNSVNQALKKSASKLIVSLGIGHLSAPFGKTDLSQFFSQRNMALIAKATIDTGFGLVGDQTNAAIGNAGPSSAVASSSDGHAGALAERGHEHETDDLGYIHRNVIRSLN